MAITTGSHPKALWPGVKAFFGKEYAEKPMACDTIFAQHSSDKAYEDVVEETGFGLAPVKSEGQSVSYDTDKQGYTTRFTNTTYGLGAIITKEAISDNQYESVAEKKARRLARSMRQTRENVHANILNRAFNASYVGGDGVALMSDAHPTLNGTQSNKLAVPADFSEGALEDVLILIRQMEDSRGLRIQAEGTRLVNPSSLNFEVTRVLQSTLRPGTDHNDINALRANGLLPAGSITWDYLTDEDAWFVQTDVPEGLMTMNRWALELTQDNDFDTDNARMKATERYVAKWGDWRGIFGSEGAA